MSLALGKRKRVTRAELEQAAPSPGSSDAGTEDLQAIFRRAFEAKFKPLPVEHKKPKMEEAEEEEEEEEEEEDDEDEESDWSGISEDEGNAVQVIEYKDSQRERDDEAVERAELKAFMSSKPPTLTSTKATKKHNHASSSSSDPSEPSNLKNDLALQKLLRESHILSASSSGTSTPTLTASGVARHKSTDLHLQALGAKTSVFAQAKMPMAQRKHEALKARLTEEKRRAHAKEAGIVLERERRGGAGGGAGADAKMKSKRERGVGGPSIGRFRGGTLSLSKQDVRSITGGGSGGVKGKGKGKGKIRKK